MLIQIRPWEEETYFNDLSGRKSKANTFEFNIMSKKKYETNNLPTPELIPFFSMEFMLIFQFSVFFLHLPVFVLCHNLIAFDSGLPILAAPNVYLQTYF